MLFVLVPNTHSSNSFLSMVSLWGVQAQGGELVGVLFTSPVDFPPNTLLYHAAAPTLMIQWIRGVCIDMGLTV